MVRLIKRYKDREYKTEAKQVGTLYHVCTLDAFVNRIIEDKELGTKDNLHSSGKYHNDLLGTYDAISFTRDSLFVVPTWTVSDGDILFQFVVDGDKLSEHYKITPYQARDWTQDRPTWSEKEEVVKGPIKNFKSYIKEVKFDIKSLNPTDLSKLAEPLKKVEEYLGSIPCTRTTLPYHSGDNKHGFKKFKNIQYEIKTLNDLISYIENLNDIKVSDYDDHLVNMIDSIDLFGKYYDDLSEEQVTAILKKHPEWLKKEDVFKYVFDGDNIDLIKLILDKVKNPNIKDSEGKNLLFYTDNIEIINLLLDSGIAVDAKDNYGNTALLKACINGTPEKVKLLLEHGANINLKDKMGFSPLLNSMRNHRDVAKLLLEFGADPDVKDDDGETPLMWASSSRNIEKAKLLLDYGADVNVKNKEGRTALDMVSYSDIDMAKLLIEHGADVNNKSKDDITFLIRSCYNNLDMVKFLVEHGADVNMKSKSGMSPLLSACAFNKDDIASYLLEHGADVNSKDKYGMTPLSSACSHNYTKVAKILIEHGADVNSKDKDGKTPLIWVCSNGDIELAKLLIEHGADVNSKNKYGVTPLYWACYNNHTEVAKLLLEHGAGKDLDVNNLPDYITKNKQIEDLVLSYLSKSKNESKRRMYEFAQGNIMNKVKEYDVSMKLVDFSYDDPYFPNHYNKRDGRVITHEYYHVFYKNKQVGDLSVTREYEAVMDKDYDEDDSDCYNYPEKYIDYDFNYIKDGDIIDTHIDRFDIKDTWRNIGIGTAVLTKYFRGATLAPDNEDARRLYARLGEEDYEDDSYNIGYGVYSV